MQHSRTLKCLVTPSLEDEEILLGWEDMVEWGILKKEFNILSDKDVERDLVDREKVSKSTVSSVPPPSTSFPMKQNVEEIEKQLQALKEQMLLEFHDVFVDELGEADRIVRDPVKLEVVDAKMNPYHCWSPASVSAHHEKEARRMVEAKVKAGILEEVSWSTDWCSRNFFIEKAGAPGKLLMVTDFKRVNEYLRCPGWAFPSADKIRKALRPEDRCFMKIDLCEGYHQIPIREEDRDLTATLLPWGKYCY